MLASFLLPKLPPRRLFNFFTSRFLRLPAAPSLIGSGVCMPLYYFITRNWWWSTSWCSSNDNLFCLRQQTLLPSHNPFACQILLLLLLLLLLPLLLSSPRAITWAGLTVIVDARNEKKLFRKMRLEVDADETTCPIFPYLICFAQWSAPIFSQRRRIIIIISL